MQEAKEAPDKPLGAAARRVDRAKQELEDEAAAASERALGRGLAIGVPLVTVAASVATGVVSSAGPALLVLGAGALLGTITLIWASLRTLGGDAPLPEDLELLAARTDTRGALETRKRTALRALKDIEAERALGKIDEADYADLSLRYREEAKVVLRELDEELGSRRVQAEHIAKKHLEKRGLGEETRPAADAESDADTDTESDADAEPPKAAPEKMACAKCATPNDADAAFCKRCGAPLGEENPGTESSDEDATSAES